MLGYSNILLQIQIFCIWAIQIIVQISIFYYFADSCFLFQITKDLNLINTDYKEKSSLRIKSQKIKDIKSIWNYTSSRPICRVSGTVVFDFRSEYRLRNPLHERIATGVRCTLEPRLFYTGIDAINLLQVLENCFQQVGCGWLRVPAGTSRVRPVSDGRARCQLELDMHFSSVEPLSTEGRWAILAPLRVLSFDIECAGRKGSPSYCLHTGLVSRRRECAQCQCQNQ